MQKILTSKKDDDKCRNAIPLMGIMLCLVEVTSVSKPMGNDPIVVHTFSDGESIPPCYAFGWYTTKDNDDSDINLIQDLDEFGTIFDMTPEDTAILASFIIDTASQLNLTVVPMYGGVVFTSVLINELARKGSSIEQLNGLVETDRQYATAASPAGAATLLGEIVKTGMRRFNKINLDDKVEEVAKIIKSCKFINDEGDVKPISFTGVENLLKRVKDLLFVAPEE